MKPKVSVLTTVYNGEKYIKKTIESVLNQTLENFEYIIIDDGSTDKTLEVIKEFKDERIRYFYYGENKGYFNLHNPINFGLHIARGEYIARIDADDIMYSSRLERQSKYLDNHKEIFLIGGSAGVIDDNGGFIDWMIKKPIPYKWQNKYVLRRNNIIHSSIMFRNEHLEYPDHNEHNFYKNLVRLGKNLKNLRKPVIDYRINPEGMMKQHANLVGNKYENYYKLGVREYNKHMKAKSRGEI